jgi:hypothetical protein
MSTEAEIWVCTHTRKCQWTGRYSDLIFKPHPVFRTATQGCCPNCGGVTFYVRKVPTTTPATPVYAPRVDSGMLVEGTEPATE